MSKSPILALRNITIAFAKKTLFENLSLNLFLGDRICLIGKNGVGKSTLMQAIFGNIDLEANQRWIMPNAVIGHLTQSEKITENILISTYIKKDLKLDDHKEYLIDIICEKLQINKNLYTNEISGGQKRRVNLAKSLIFEPDILLLDEPTNHLDLEIIEWLENYLSQYKGALVIISHDRKFLEKVTNKIFWLRAGNIKINNSGYADFDNWSQNIIDFEKRELDNLEKKVELESGWLQTGVTGRRKRNIGRLHHLLELKGKLESQRKLVFANQNVMKINVAKSEEDAPQVIMSFNNVSLEIQQKKLIENFTYKILRGERIGIIGKNGVGKSSLLKLMINDLLPNSGTVKMARDIDFAYFDQSRTAIKPTSTIQEILCESGKDYVKMPNGKTKHIAGYLKDFLFDPKETQTLAGTLSGGQQNRLLLAKTLANPGNFMILDEPTNDLDMDSLEILENYLEKYQGTLVVVSHDRDFLDNIATTIIGFESDGVININLGNYSDYLAKHPKIKSDLIKNSNNKTLDLDLKNEKNIVKKTNKNKYQSSKILSKIEKIQNKINELNNELEFSEDRTASNLSLIAIEINNLQIELEKLEEEWLEFEVN
ncbi:MAG: ABC-F family ATP-binding cassette domain-containing protein [Alphaproteobacteria bacterium]